MLRIAPSAAAIACSTRRPFTFGRARERLTVRARIENAATPFTPSRTSLRDGRIVSHGRAAGAPKCRRIETGFSAPRAQDRTHLFRLEGIPRRSAPRDLTARRLRFALSDVEFEQHHVAVLDHVFLALLAKEALLP